jgi:photosystem II stability/assembly factor-like uncharacterized protein
LLNPQLFKILILLFFAAFSTVFAQTIPQAAYSGLKWRLVGPFRGGRALAAAGVPGNPYLFYFGSVDGGMWKTENAGVTWESISNGLTNSSVGAFAVSPSDPNVIYVGTGEADMRSDITYGDGVYKSTDAGAHWQHIGLDDTRQIGKILIDPHNPDLVLIAALGHAYGPNTERGVFRTTDGGKNWQKVLYKNPDAGAIDLGWDQSDPSVVYAAMWQARRTPWSQYPPDEGAGSGLYKSTDEGLTWNEISGNGLPAKPYGRIGVAVANGSHGNVVYALIQDLKKGSGLYRSDNGGTSWQRTGKDNRIARRMWYFSQVFVDPKNSDVVYCPNIALMRSVDGGKTFAAIKGAPGGDDYHYLWIDPDHADRLIVASDQGTAISVDDGMTWSSWYNQPTGQFYHVTTDNQFPYKIYGAQQDAGTVSISSRSDYGSITFRDWLPIGAGESGYIAPDPINPNIVYGGDTYGGVYRFDRVTGQSQVISPSLLAEFGKHIASRKLRFTWTSPIVFDPRNPHTIYLGAQMVLRTEDGGIHWKSISPDLTRHGTFGSSSDSSHSGWGVVYTIAPSPVKRGLIWAGTDDGFIQVTHDGGLHWKNVTPAGLGTWSKISMIEASPFDAGTAYVEVDRHRLDDVLPYIYKTTDYGEHWTRADNGIPAGSYVRSVRSDLKRKGLLYAGTETGVYVSFDDGNNWQSLQLNLPVASVHDLAVHENDLIAATHGRAFWVLDDLAPLQQFTKNVLDSDVYLFKPETAVRIRRSENTDTPLPPEEPQGENPPDGAIIDYYFKSELRGSVTLEILDASGNIIRKYSSEDIPPADTIPQVIADYWIPKFKPLTTNAGLNRFVWNLRYSPPPISDYGYGMSVANLKSVREPEGPLALPGKYEVRLSYDGHIYSQPLEIVMDPRVKVMSTALKDQLELAVELWNTISDANSLHSDLDAIKGQLMKILHIGGVDSRIRRNADSLVVLISKVNNSSIIDEMSGLEEDIMRADREPTEEMKEAYHSLKEKFFIAENEWMKIGITEVAELNGELEKAHYEPVQVSKEPAKHLNTVLSNN